MECLECKDKDHLIESFMTTLKYFVKTVDKLNEDVKKAHDAGYQEALIDMQNKA